MLEARRVYRSPSSGPIDGAAGPDAGIDLVVAGAASRDVVGADPRGWRLGGSATYCSLTAARLGLRVGCLLGVDEDAADAEELDLLREAGVSLQLVTLASGPVVENIEVDGHRRQRWTARSDFLPVAELPAGWRRAGGWLLVPIAGELGPEWGAAPPAGSAAGVGWQGLLREFDADGWVKRIGPEPSPLLARAGLVVASVDDVPRTVAISELRSLAPDATIVLTAGEGGGLAMLDGKFSRYRALAAARVVDATGAGDVFLAALMAAWMLTGERAPASGLRFAAAVASCVVEDVGLAGVPTMGRVAARLRPPVALG